MPNRCRTELLSAWLALGPSGGAALAAGAGGPAAVSAAAPAVPGAAGAPLPLAQAIDMAVTFSPKRQEAEADLRASNASRKGALADTGPKVRAEGTDARFDKPVDIAFGPDVFTIRPPSYQDGSLTIDQPITGFYAAFEKAGLARATANNAEVTLQLAGADAAFGVAEAYRRAQLADEYVRIARASILATNSQERDARSLESAGKLIRSDLLKIQIAGHEARAQLAKATAGQAKAHARLRYLVGLPPDPSNTPLKLEPLPPPSAVATYAPPSLGDAVAKAGQTRLEVKQAALGVEQAEYGQRLSKARFAPNVDVFATWDRVYSEPPFGTPPFTRTYGVKASWDLWDNGSQVYAAQAANAKTEKAQTALKEVQDKLSLEVQGLLADLGAARQALLAAEASVTQAEEAYRLDQARFASGLVTTTDLLLSEAGQTRARGALVTTITETDLIIFSLQKALGESRPH